MTCKTCAHGFKPGGSGRWECNKYGEDRLGKLVRPGVVDLGDAAVGISRLVTAVRNLEVVYWRHAYCPGGKLAESAAIECDCPGWASEGRGGRY